MTTNPSNLFIAFEGIDGSGKSTHLRLLAEKLEEAGHKVYSTFEPTDSLIGSMINNIMKGRVEADPYTIAGLFVADRLDHILNKTNGIRKMLDEGYTVLTDRYYFSSYAYQGAQIPMDWVIQANAKSAEFLKPDLNIYLDIEPELAIERIHSGRSSTQLYETVKQLHTIREQYFKAFEKLKDQENIVNIDSNRPKNTIADDIWETVSGLLK